MSLPGVPEVANTTLYYELLSIPKTATPEEIKKVMHDCGEFGCTSRVA